MILELAWGQNIIRTAKMIYFSMCQKHNVHQSQSSFDKGLSLFPKIKFKRNLFECIWQLCLLTSWIFLVAGCRKFINPTSPMLATRTWTKLKEKLPAQDGSARIQEMLALYLYSGRVIHLYSCIYLSLWGRSVIKWTWSVASSESKAQ